MFSWLSRSCIAGDCTGFIGFRVYRVQAFSFRAGLGITDGFGTFFWRGIPQIHTS